MDRRAFMRASIIGGIVAAGAGTLSACGTTTPWGTGITLGYGPLQPADANGLLLPAGFTSRVIATTGSVVPGTSYTWHVAPDGGACFAMPDGGWIYVSNSEVGSALGGAGMVRFDSTGAIVDAKRILSGTSGNCAGGATPWGTWLSCEETSTGRVWECDPTGATAAVVRPAMGRFKHEAAAADATTQTIYLTEDDPTGALYRFKPTTWGDLSAGVLEVLTESGGALSWVVVPDPSAATTATRLQVPNTKVFVGGEGVCVGNGVVCFTTKGDNKVWSYGIVNNTLTVLYDDDTSTTPVLTGVDNITLDRQGALYISEDGGNMQIVAVGPDQQAIPVVEFTGVTGSEVTGPAFSPDGTRLYFSSQRNPGRTYEVTGPWH